MRFQYQVYGLPLLADRAIPGLVHRSTAVANPWQIRLGTLPHEIDGGEKAESACLYVSRSRGADGAPSWKIWRIEGKDFLRFRFHDGTDFVIDHQSKNIWGSWLEPLTLEDTATYLLGPVLGFVLRLTGTICLHASAVAVGDRAVVFAGPPGAGKSTTAAAFAKLGFAILSDDIVALSEQAGYFMVQAGYPRLNLWPDSAQALGDAANTLPRITPTWEKCYLDLSADRRRFQAEPSPLTAVYLLGARTDQPRAPRVESMAAHVGLIELIGNGYANHLLDSRLRAEEFSLLGRLANALPPRRLIPHAEPMLLPKLCHAVLADLRFAACSSTECLSQGL